MTWESHHAGKKENQKLKPHDTASVYKVTVMTSRQWLLSKNVVCSMTKHLINKMKVHEHKVTLLGEYKPTDMHVYVKCRLQQ